MSTLETKKVGIGGYIALLLALIFFSGLLKGQGIWSAFDFSTLQGSFGTITGNEGASFTFLGKSGSGAKDAFMQAINLTPAIMLALAMVSVFEHFGALSAARQSLTPILKPLLGISGICALAMVASWQSTDGGGSMTRELCEAGEISEDEKAIFIMYQFSGAAPLINYMGTAATMFALTLADGSFAISVPLIIPFVLLMVLKFFGAALFRFYLKWDNKRTAAKMA